MSLFRALCPLIKLLLFYAVLYDVPYLLFAHLPALGAERRPPRLVTKRYARSLSHGLSPIPKSKNPSRNRIMSTTMSKVIGLPSIVVSP